MSLHATLRAVILLASILLYLSPTPPHQSVGVDPSTPPDQEDYATEEALVSAARPARDLIDLAERLKGVEVRARAARQPTTTGWKVGSSEEFWVNSLESNEYTRRRTILQHVSQNAYWFVEEGREFGIEALRRSAERFDAISATNRRAFGSEWSPGIDGDPRIVVLVAATPGAGGYFSAADEFPNEINPYSNEHEMIYVDADPGSAFFEATLAHEFQHMIHWYHHPNQDVWLNEGMAEYAVELNGLDSGVLESQYAHNPDTQLNAWAAQPSQAAVHYGQAYRFMSYLGHRFGSEIMKDIILAPATGFDAIDHALASRGTSLQQVYEEWLAANYVRDGRKELSYGVRVAEIAAAEVVRPFERRTSVAQWGADYYQLTSGSAHEVQLRADATVPLLDVSPRVGRSYWYSNRGDSMDCTLTRPLDLREVRSATLLVDMWYDIEQDFDYAYVEVSTDGGSRWQSVPGSVTTATNPNGTNLGNGITGRSDTWVTAHFDLSQYAGQAVLLRFEYVTDDGFNAQGIAVDRVRVPEIGLDDHTETDGGWIADGWVRVGGTLPARYVLLATDRDNGGSVEEVPVGADGRTFALFGPDDGTPQALVVGGSAVTTTQQSQYVIAVTGQNVGTLALIGGRAVPDDEEN